MCLLCCPVESNRRSIRVVAPFILAHTKSTRNSSEMESPDFTFAHSSFLVFQLKK